MEFKKNIIKHHGFTLAEVLITLAIIGVVAALTVPAVTQKVQYQKYYTKFIKTYNTLTSVYNAFIAQGGDAYYTVHECGICASKNGEEYFRENFGRYMKIENYCSGNPQACGIDEATYGSKNIGYLNYSTSLNTSLYSDINNSDVSFILSDGTIIVMKTIRAYISIKVFLYGKNGPHIHGRDVFMFYLDNRTPDGKYRIYPNGLYRKDNSTGQYLNRTLEELQEECSTTVSSTGTYCGARLLLEKKMDY